MPTRNALTPDQDTASVRVAGPRPTPAQIAREIRDVVTSLPLFILSPLLRPWHLRWGATRAEVDASMPGDHLVQCPHFNATRAVTIDAPPTAVWPWLAQVGFGRAGFYSNDLLDNQAHASAETIVPQWQNLSVGDWVPMYSTITEDTAFRVAEVSPPESLVWTTPGSTWSWTLSETADGQTRLVTRLRCRYNWHRPGSALVSVTVLELADFPMMRRMLLGIKRRAEGERGAELRRKRRQRRVIASGALAVTAAAAIARIGRRSGATTAEVRAVLPGDDLVASPRWASTRAITIDASTQAVWPWIVQMGFPAHRAGWYTPHWLDRLMWGITARSADGIIPELQDLAVGDHVSDSVDGSAYFVASEVDPGRALVLHSTRHVLPAYRDLAFSWAFVLRPVGARTRLLIRARTSFEDVWPRPLVSAFVLLAMGPGDWFNVSVMLRGIRRRAEAPAAGQEARHSGASRPVNDDGRPGGRPSGERSS